MLIVAAHGVDQMPSAQPCLALQLRSPHASLRDALACCRNRWRNNSNVRQYADQLEALLHLYHWNDPQARPKTLEYLRHLGRLHFDDRPVSATPQIRASAGRACMRPLAKPEGRALLGPMA